MPSISASFHLLALTCHPASSGLCTVCIAFHARNNRQGRLEAAIGATDGKCVTKCGYS